MSQMFTKRQNTFEGHQFTGGRKNAMELISWFNDQFGIATRYETVAPPALDGEEFFFVRSRRLPLNTWFVKDSFHGELNIFTPDEFEQMFEPIQESRNDFFVTDDANLKFTDSGIEEATVAEMHEPRLEKVELNGLFSLEGVLHGRRMDNGEYVPIVVRDGKPTLIDNPKDDLTEISNGVIDDVVCGVVGADYIIEQTKYNEDTLYKVERALMDCRIGQPQAADLTRSMINAGILFRERV